MLTGKFVVSGCFAAILGCWPGLLWRELSWRRRWRERRLQFPSQLGSLKSALSSSITASSGANGGLGFNMWGVIVDNSGIVCAVAFSGGELHVPMACKPSDRRPEGEYGQLAQP